MAMPKKKTATGGRLLRNANATPPKGYPKDRNKYAIPSEYKYPLDTTARIKSAMAYWANSRQRKGYTKDEVQSVARRIINAARKKKIAITKGSQLWKVAGYKV